MNNNNNIPYVKHIKEAKKSLALENADIKITYSEDTFGGRVIRLDRPELKDSKLRFDAEILLGKKTMVYSSEKGYIYHELSHLIHFSLLMIDLNATRYQDLMEFFFENPEQVIKSEIIAEIIGTVISENQSEVAKREFNTWRWWKTPKCFNMAMDNILKYADRFNKNQEALEIALILKSDSVLDNLSSQILDIMSS